MLFLLLVAIALAVARTKDLLAAAIIFSAYSLVLCLLWQLAGRSGRGHDRGGGRCRHHHGAVPRGHQQDREAREVKKALVAALLIITAIPLLIAVLGAPAARRCATPRYSTGASARYLEHGAEEAGAENIVTGVILNYRGLDTARRGDRHLHGARRGSGRALARSAGPRHSRLPSRGSSRPALL